MAYLPCSDGQNISIGVTLRIMLLAAVTPKQSAFARDIAALMHHRSNLCGYKS